MPWKPKKPCTWPGCPELTDRGRCEEHRKQAAQEYDRSRCDDEMRRFYNSRAWRRVSKLHIQDESLCRACMAEGRLVPAVMTDHIAPIKQGGDRWDERNLQSLCQSCHSRKSAEEGSRFGSQTDSPRG